MKKYHLRVWTLTATAALALAAGCNTEPEYNATPTDTPMAITVSMAQEPKPQAAASKAALRDGAFINGEQLGLYVVANRKADLAGVLENKYNYVDNAMATFNSAAGGSWSISPSIFFPTVLVDIYGYAPYDANFSPTENPAAYEFTVASDQKANISRNDLLTAITPQIVSSTTPIGMTFYHRLSRVEVKFKVPASFKGRAITGVKSVAYKNFHPTAVVDLITPYTYTIDGAATGGTYPKPATAKVATPVDITPSEIQRSTPGNAATDGTEYFIYEALVPPQSLAANAGFVEIVVEYTDTTTETFFYINSSTPPTFLAAKSATLEVTFQKDYTILLGTVSITPWVHVAGSSGEVVQREVFNRFAITLPATSATQVAFVTLTTKIGTEAEVEYLLPATHTVGTNAVTCAFDGTQNSPEFYAFNITKVEWLDANRVSLGSKTLNTPTTLTASGNINISLL